MGGGPPPPCRCGRRARRPLPPPPRRRPQGPRRGPGPRSTSKTSAAATAGPPPSPRPPPPPPPPSRCVALLATRPFGTAVGTCGSLWPVIGLTANWGPGGGGLAFGVDDLLCESLVAVGAEGGVPVPQEGAVVLGSDHRRCQPRCRRGTSWWGTSGRRPCGPHRRRRRRRPPGSPSHPPSRGPRCAALAVPLPPHLSTCVHTKPPKGQRHTSRNSDRSASASRTSLHSQTKPWDPWL